MKIRTDFVTNSSSSSFIFDKSWTHSNAIQLLTNAYEYTDELFKSVENTIKNKNKDLYNEIVRYFNKYSKYTLNMKYIYIDKFYIDMHSIEYNTNFEYVMKEASEKFNEKFETELSTYGIIHSYLDLNTLYYILSISRHRLSIRSITNLNTINNVIDEFSTICEMVDWYDIGDVVFKDVTNEQLMSYDGIPNFWREHRSCYKDSPWIKDCKGDCETCELGDDIKTILARSIKYLSYNENITNDFKMLVINLFNKNIGSLFEYGWEGDTNYIALAIYEKYCKYSCNHMG